MDDAKAGKVKRANSHDRLDAATEADILSNSDAVFLSHGKHDRLIFQKEGNVVVTETGAHAVKSSRVTATRGHAESRPEPRSSAAVLRIRVCPSARPTSKQATYPQQPAAR